MMLTSTSLDDLALDRLAAAVEQAGDDPCSRAVLAVVVQRLEQAAGAELGDTTGDPVVVLQRRFGRAHARLAAAGGGHADLLLGLAGALAPEPVAEPRPSARPVLAALPAGC